LKKALVLVTVLLAVIGLIIVLTSGMPVNHKEKSPLTNLIEYTWSPSDYIWDIELNFTKGDFVWLEITKPTIWGEPPYDTAPLFPPSSEGYHGPKLLWIYFNYTEPENQTELTTQFEDVYYRDVKTGRLVVGYRHLYWKGSIYHNNTYDGCFNPSPTLTVTQPKALMSLGGTVRYNGTYRITIMGPSPIPVIPTEEPFEWTVFVQFYREKTTITKPYSFMLPIGIGTLIIGTVCSIFTSAKLYKTRKVRKRLKKRTA